MRQRIGRPLRVSHHNLTVERDPPKKKKKKANPSSPHRNAAKEWADGDKSGHKDCVSLEKGGRLAFFSFFFLGSGDETHFS